MNKETILEDFKSKFKDEFGFEMTDKNGNLTLLGALAFVELALEVLKKIEERKKQ